MKRILQTLALCAALACGACTVDAPVADHTSAQTQTIYRLMLQADKPSYDASRADASWADGDVVYIKFATGDNSSLSGTAVYRADDQNWELHCSSAMPTTTGGKCTIHYLEGDVDAETHMDKIILSPNTCIYATNSTYTKTATAVLISATLKPVNGRVRFTGAPGRDFTVSGLRMSETFLYPECELIYTTSATSVIGEDGSSQYIYMNKSMPEDPVLTVSYDNLSFTRLCKSPILDAGTSGYMQLPTRDVHNKWTMSETTAPIMGNATVSDIGIYAATFEASVVSDGNADITERGFVYATSDNPTTSDHKIVCAGDEFKATSDGLSASTTYYVRAYAINSEGIGYSSSVKFQTLAAPEKPTVETGSVSDISDISAVVSANLVALGNVESVSQYGHVWSTKPAPTLQDARTELGKKSTTGQYTSALTALSPNTTYYVRAYATNSEGTAYGQEVTFTTKYGDVMVETSAVTNITYKSATITSQILSTGGNEITECGVCIATKHEPSVSDQTVQAASVSTEYTVTVAGLTDKTTYYVRAYVRTAKGQTCYGAEKSFTTASKDIIIDKDEYPGEDNWDSRGTGTVGVSGYGPDSDWNTTASAGVGKDGYGNDSDWNTTASAGVGKDGYGGDSDWNTTPSAGVGKDGYGGDSDWNTTASAGVGKDGYETDSDWNKK